MLISRVCILRFALFQEVLVTIDVLAKVAHDDFVADKTPVRATFGQRLRLASNHVVDSACVDDFPDSRDSLRVLVEPVHDVVFGAFEKVFVHVAANVQACN